MATRTTRSKTAAQNQVSEDTAKLDGRPLVRGRGRPISKTEQKASSPVTGSSSKSKRAALHDEPGSHVPPSDQRRSRRRTADSRTSEDYALQASSQLQQSLHEVSIPQSAVENLRSRRSARHMNPSASGTGTENEHEDTAGSTRRDESLPEASEAGSLDVHDRQPKRSTRVGERERLKNKEGEQEVISSDKSRAPRVNRSKRTRDRGDTGPSSAASARGKHRGKAKPSRTPESRNEESNGDEDYEEGNTDNEESKDVENTDGANENKRFTEEEESGAEQYLTASNGALHEWRENRRKDLLELQRRWERLHEERRLVEGYLPSVEKIQHLRFWNSDTDVDSNGKLFIRVELFLPRVGPSPGFVKHYRDEFWNDEEHSTLETGLREYAGPDVYEKVIRAFCKPGGVLHRFNVTQIVCAAGRIKEQHLQEDEQGAGEWIRNLFVWTRANVGDGQENEPSSPR